jgi:hypothetical protein
MFLMAAVPVGMGCVEQLFIHAGHCTSSLQKFCSGHGPCLVGLHFAIELHSFMYILSISSICDLQVFSLLHRLSFHCRLCSLMRKKL